MLLGSTRILYKVRSIHCLGTCVNYTGHVKERILCVQGMAACRPARPQGLNELSAPHSALCVALCVAVAQSRSCPSLHLIKRCRLRTGVQVVSRREIFCHGMCAKWHACHQPSSEKLLAAIAAAPPALLTAVNPLQPTSSSSCDTGSGSTTRCGTGHCPVP